MKSFLKHHIPLIAAVLLGLVLRLYNNTAISLWHDEAFSALLIKYPWKEMLYRIGLDVHPPFYYVLLRLWSYVFGDTLLALRGFSIFFGVATIVAAYYLVKLIFKSRTAALWAALLVAINPFQIQYVTEARMYTLGAFLGIIAAYFLVKALHFQKAYYDTSHLHIPHLPEAQHLRKLSTFYFLLSTLSMSAMMYTHYYLFFAAAALCLYALYYHWTHYKDDLKKYFILSTCYFLLIILYIPWLKTFLFQFKQVSDSYWIPPMDKWSIPTTFWQMFIGWGVDITKTSTQWIVIVACTLSLVAFVQFLRKNSAPEKWLIVLNILAPFAGAVVFLLLAKARGQSSSVFLVRYFLFASTFYTIMLSVWLFELRPKKLSQILFIIYCFGSLISFIHYWQDLDVATKPGMAGAAKFLKANVAPNDKLYVGSSFEFFNLKYYWSILPLQKGELEGVKPRPLLFSGSNTEVSNLPHFAGTAILTNQDLVPDFAAATKSGDTVWLLWTNGFGGTKPSVPKNWTAIDLKFYPDARPYVGTWIYVVEYKVN